MLKFFKKLRGWVYLIESWKKLGHQSELRFIKVKPFKDYAFMLCISSIIVNVSYKDTES